MDWQQQQRQSTSNLLNNDSKSINDVYTIAAALLLAPIAAAVAIGRAAKKNNEGSQYFEQGDMSRAYLCFLEALETLNGEVSTLVDNYTIEMALRFPQQQLQVPISLLYDQIQTNATLTQQIGTILREQSNHPPKWFLQNQLQQQQGQGEGERPSPRHMTQEQSTFFLYWKPFHISPPPQGLTATSSGTLGLVTRESLALCKGQVMFNLAMVMHKGENCTNLRGSTGTALTLYKMCLEYSILHRGCCCGILDVQQQQQQLQQQQQQQQHNHDHAGWLLLTIACLNNKAHVFHEFCEPNSLAEALDALFLCLGFLAQQEMLVEPMITTTKLMDHDDLQGILFNVYMLRQLPCSRAA